MTRQFRITNLEQDGSESPVLVTMLTDKGQSVPTPVQPGRELIATVHDGCEAVIITKRPIKDIEHPLFGDYQFGKAAQGVDGSKTSAQYEQEIYGLKADVERLEAEKERGFGENLTDEQKEALRTFNPEVSEGGQPTIPAEPWRPFHNRTKAELKDHLDANSVEHDKDDSKADLVAAAEDHDIDALDKMTKADLVQTAKDRGIEVDEKATKAEIVDAIKFG